MNTTTECTTHIAERLQVCLPHLAIDWHMDAHLADQGLDSMDTVELLCAIHEEFGVRLTEGDLHPEQTIGGLLTAIADKIQPRAES